MSAFPMVSRLAVVALLCFVGLTAAQTFTQCPSVTGGGASAFRPTGTCAPLTECLLRRCTCSNGTFSTATSECSIARAPTCARATECAGSFLTCVRNIAANSSCMSAYQVDIIAVLAGTAYEGSGAQTACRSSVCNYFNTSSPVGSCNGANVHSNVSVNALCAAPTPAPPTPVPAPTPAPPPTPAPTVLPVNGTYAPVPIPARPTLAPEAKKYVAQLVLSGTFTTILADPVKKEALRRAVEFDLLVALALELIVTALLDGSLVVKFELQKVVAGDASVTTLLAAKAAPGGMSLGAVQAAYVANGGTGSVGVASLGEAPAPAPVVFFPRNAAPAASVFTAAVATVAAMIFLM